MSCSVIEVFGYQGFIFLSFLEYFRGLGKKLTFYVNICFIVLAPGQRSISDKIYSYVIVTATYFRLQVFPNLKAFLI